MTVYWPVELLPLLVVGLEWQDFMPGRIYLTCRAWNKAFMDKYMAYRPDRCKVLFTPYADLCNFPPIWIRRGDMVALKRKDGTRVTYIWYNGAYHSIAWNLAQITIPKYLSIDQYPSVRYFAGAMPDGTEKYSQGYAAFNTQDYMPIRQIVVYLAGLNYDMRGETVSETAFIWEWKGPSDEIVYTMISGLKSFPTPKEPYFFATWSDSLPCWWNAKCHLSLPRLTTENLMSSASAMRKWLPARDAISDRIAVHHMKIFTYDV